MKRIAVTLILSMTVILLPAQEKAKLYSGQPAGVPFSDFIVSLESETGVHIFFKDEWVEGLTVTGIWENASPLEVISMIIAPRGLNCFDDRSGNIIITRGYRVRTDFSVDSTDLSVLYVTDTIKTASLNGKESDVITFGRPADRKLEGRAYLSGYVTNDATGEPIPGASVYIRELALGAMTNNDGYYSLSAPRGSYKVEYRSLGSYDTYRNINLWSSGRINIALIERVIAIKEAVVTASRREKLDRLESGMAKMNIMTIRLSPSSLGEADLIKSVLLMPGVQSVGEGAAGFNVRGGSADQNLILLYGAPMYYSSHFFGFFSSVNSEVINDISLYKGGIPAQFGGRVSSIMDITERDGNKKEFSGNVGISMVAAHATVEGPIVKDKSSFHLAGRTTYSNWMLDLLPNAALRNSTAGFYDINGHVITDIGKNSKLELSAYLSHDSFRFNSDTTYTYDNLIVAARFRHSFSQSLFSVFSLNNSNFRYEVSNSGIPEYAATMAHKVNTTSGKANLTWYLTSGHEMQFGAETALHLISPGTRIAVPPLSVIKNETIDSETGLETSIYADYKAELAGRLTARAGFRLSSFLALGPQTVYIYNPLFSKEMNTIVDSIYFDPGSIIKAYAGPEARLSLNYRLSGGSSLKVNYNRTYQYLHLLSNTISVSPTDTWKMSDYHIKPQYGDQVAAGIYFDILDNDYELSVDGYYKWLHNMIDYKGGAVLTMNELIEQDLIPTEGKAYGVEVMLKKNRGKFKTTLNYTWSRVLLRSTGSFDSEIINTGAYYPANYDRPHDFNLQFSYLYSRRINWSMSFVYTTGRPVTYPVTWYMHDGVNVIHYSDRNQYRLPDYFRWDISMNLYSNLKASKTFRPSWNISIYNVTGRENIYSVYFRMENGKIQGYSLSIFGTTIPTVSYRIDF